MALNPLSFTGVFRTILATEDYVAPSGEEEGVAPAPWVTPDGLREGLANSEFDVRYQPKVAADSRLILGAEALLRWKHPVHGMTLPGAFIETAESSGVIHELGAWVLRRVSEFNAGMAALPDENDCKLAVNVSPVQFSNAAYLKALLAAAAQLKLPSHRMEIEITETSVFNNLGHAANLMDLIRSYGVSIAIDDFGTGFSSLQHLARLPVSTVKIDASFVKRMPHSNIDRKIVAGIVSLCRDLELITVAEGVETEQQAQMLTEMGCDQLQGFLFGQPMTATEFQMLWMGGLGHSPGTKP
jgi:diguanylate cyclase